MLNTMWMRETACPLFQAGSCSMLAALLTVAAKRQKLCCSDDYDSCPAYLGYVLRRTRPLRVDNDWLDAR